MSYIPDIHHLVLWSTARDLHSVTARDSKNKLLCPPLPPFPSPHQPYGRVFNVAFIKKYFLSYRLLAMPLPNDAVIFPSPGNRLVTSVKKNKNKNYVFPSDGRNGGIQIQFLLAIKEELEQCPLPSHVNAQGESCSDLGSPPKRSIDTLKALCGHSLRSGCVYHFCSLLPPSLFRKIPHPLAPCSTVFLSLGYTSVISFLQPWCLFVLGLVRSGTVSFMEWHTLPLSSGYSLFKGLECI